MSTNIYSLKKIKLEKSLKLVDDISYELINDFIFDTIIDFFRINYGFPCATLLSDLIIKDSVVPQTPDDLAHVIFDSSNPNFITSCPLCNQAVNDGNFTDHWIQNCVWFQKKKSLKSHVLKYFTEHDKKKD